MLSSVFETLTPEEAFAIFLQKYYHVQYVEETTRHQRKKTGDLLEKHNWSKLVPTQCHGDMTLENIIIKDDRMYFIDFLDSFYDSWFLDIGTLLQDVQVMWSYRFQNEVNMNTVLRLIVFRDLLLDEISKIDSSYVIEIYYSLLQKLIRIYPYTEDEFTYNFLNEKTGIVLKNIKALEEQVREGA